MLNIIASFFFSQAEYCLYLMQKNLQGILFGLCYMERACKVQSEKENPCLPVGTQIELKYTLTCTLRCLMPSKVLKTLSLE